MYSVVMMMALSGGAEVPQFGCGGCCGYCSGSYGCSGGYGCRGCNGCRGGYSCGGGYSYGGGYGCCGCCGGGGIYMPPAGEQLPGPKKRKGEVSANLVVTLPVDAKLLIDGKATNNNGNSTNRFFTTPPLEVGWDYQFTLRAEVMRDGQRRILTQDVTVRPGEQTRVSMMDFTKAESETVGSSSP